MPFIFTPLILLYLSGASRSHRHIQPPELPSRDQPGSANTSHMAPQGTGKTSPRLPQLRGSPVGPNNNRRRRAVSAASAAAAADGAVVPTMLVVVACSFYAGLMFDFDVGGLDWQ